MEISWNGKDITDYVYITGCTVSDVAGGKADSAQITFAHASVWYRWAPRFGDEIIITHEGYSTGKLFLNAVMPVNDEYRVIATSLKQEAQRRSWGHLYNTTLQKTAEYISAECGMKGRLYGIDGNLAYDYLLRKNEGCAAFLDRICAFEGAVVKTYNETFRIISVEWAQKREPLQRIEIDSKQPGVTYRRRDGFRYKGITVKTPYAEVTASDISAEGNNIPVLTYLPAMSAAQAGRWARGLLLMHNRNFEELTLEQQLNLQMTALERIDVLGETDASGKWIAEETEHDLINKNTVTRFVRVIESVQ